MHINEFLKYLAEKQGSDLHLKVGLPPVIRLKGELTVTEFEKITPESIKNLLYSILNDEQKKRYETEREIDFSYNIPEVARFRVNAFFQKGCMGAIFRIIPQKVPTLESLGLPLLLKDLVKELQGLILVTGPTGSGKTTTLASLIDYINENFSNHIITIEDPIEFVYTDKKCIIDQREIGIDTLSFSQALRRALRQDPDVILVGELRDAETISIAVTAAETGHLVFSTLHTNDCKQTIDRIIDTFPPEQHHQVRMQIALVLKSVISQRLIPKNDGSGRIAAMEIMINTPTIKKLIEEGKTGAIAKAIEDSATFYKMQSFNQSLFKLVMDGSISEENALAISQNPNDLKLQLQTQKFSASKAKEDTQAQTKTGIKGRFGGYKV